MKSDALFVAIVEFIQWAAAREKHCGRNLLQIRVRVATDHQLHPHHPKVPLMLFELVQQRSVSLCDLASQVVQEFSTYPEPFRTFARSNPEAHAVRLRLNNYLGDFHVFGSQLDG